MGKAKIFKSLKESKKGDAPNPFEVRKQKVKHKVTNRSLGKKKPTVAQARSKDHEIRTKTLAKEYKNRHKAGAFVDRRIGEGSMDKESAMQERYQRERLRDMNNAGSSEFGGALDDDGISMGASGGGDGFTVGGMDLAGMNAEQLDALSRRRMDDDYEDDNNPAGKIEAGQVSSAHFGGFTRRGPGQKQQEGEGERRRTQKEIYQEVIDKSKAHRKERKKVALELGDLMAQNDADFDSVRHDVMGAFGRVSKKLSQGKVDAAALMDKVKSGTDVTKVLAELEAARAARANNKKPLMATMTTSTTIGEEEKNRELKGEFANFAGTGAAMDSDEEEGEGKDEAWASYMSTVHDLSNNIRAVATDRTKTVEERAAEENDRLQTLEKERLRRQSGIEGSAKASLKEDVVEDDDQHMGADDLLDGNYAIEDDDGELFAGGRKAGVAIKARSMKASGDEDLELMDPEGAELASRFPVMEADGVLPAVTVDVGLVEVVDPEDIESLGFLDNEVYMIETADIHLCAPDVPAVSEEEEESLPYVMEFPDTYEDLAGLLAEHPVGLRATLIERLVASNSVHLRAQNRGKMQLLVRLLLTRAVRISNAGFSLENGSPVRVELDAITVALYELTQVVGGRFTSTAVRAHVVAIRARIRALMRWPTVGELVMLRLTGVLFPMSDLVHPVTTPTVTMMQECLATTPLSGPKDLPAALFMCTLLLDAVHQSKRFVPEVVRFLVTILAALSGSPLHHDLHSTTVNRSVGQLSATQVTGALPSTIDISVAAQEALAKSKIPEAAFDTQVFPGLATVSVKTNLGLPLGDTAPVGCSSGLTLGDLVPSTAANVLKRRHVASIVSVSRLLERASITYGEMDQIPELGKALSHVSSSCAKSLQKAGKKAQKRARKKAKSKGSKVANLESVASVAGKAAAGIAKVWTTTGNVRLNARIPLQLQARRKEALTTYNPKFISRYSLDRHYDVDHERQTVKKLKALVKKERKATIRELKKDTLFLHQERRKEQEAFQAKRAESNKRVNRLLTQSSQELKKPEKWWKKGNFK